MANSGRALCCCVLLLLVGVSVVEGGYYCDYLWKYYEGKCYRLFTFNPKRTFHDANNYCSKHYSGRLAEAPTQGHNEFLGQLMKDKNVLEAWFGYVRTTIPTGKDNITSDHRRKQFYFPKFSENGAEIDYHAWYANEPQPYDNCARLRITKSGGVIWLGKECDQQYLFLCEKSTPAPATAMRQASTSTRISSLSSLLLACVVAAYAAV